MSGGFPHSRDMRITTNAKDGRRDFYDHDDRNDNRSDGRRGGGRGGGGRGGGGGGSRRGGGGGGYDSRESGGGRSSGGGRWQRGGGQKRRGRGRGGGGGGRGGGPSPLSRLDDDGDVAMGDEGGGPSRPRFNPYGRQDRDSRKGRNQQQNRDQGGRGGGSRRDGPSHGLFSRAVSSLDSGGRRNNDNRNGPRDIRGGSRDKRRDQDRSGRGDEDTWYKITIPWGKKQDKEWLLSAIRNVCTVPFQAIDYHFVQNSSAFFVDDKATADALRNVSKRITAKSGHKVSILTRASQPPKGQPVLNEKKLQLLKEAMSKRYDPSTKLLNLGNMYVDEDMKAANCQISLNKPAYMKEVVKIISENIPEILILNLGNNRLFGLQSLMDLVSKTPDLKFLDLSDNSLKNDAELDIIQGFKLEELILRGNPFVTGYKENVEYISAVRKRFPQLLRLDGETMPPPIVFDLESSSALPPIQNTFFASKEIEAVLTKFIEDYYNVFDSSNRQGILTAYHEQARFSFTASFGPNAPNHIRNMFNQFRRDSRNLLRVSDGNMRVKLLKQGQLATVAFLDGLPQMQHDTSSFQVDVSRAEIGGGTNNLLAFTVHGVFKDVSKRSSSDQPVIAFSRFFVTIPNPATGSLTIINDELSLRPPTSNQKRAAFSSAAPTPSPSPVTVPVASPAPAHGLTTEQQAMIQQFINDSNMNLEWSLKCLQENNWDYPAAGNVFMQLKANGSIPPEAFVK